MSGSNETIREYRPADAQQVERCIAELQDFSKLIYANMADGSIAPLYLLHLLSQSAMTNGKIFVAEDEGRVIGMVCIYANVKSDAADEEQNEYAYVSDLVVLEEFRGKGFGRALLKHAEDYAKKQGATVLRLNVLARNGSAKRLYVDYGFAEHVVTMQKQIP